jgi:hypothetical protein
MYPFSSLILLIGAFSLFTLVNVLSILFH